VTALAPHSLQDSLPAHAKLIQALRQRDAHLASVSARLLVAQIKDFVEQVLGTQGK
jgi:DNA-binding FadR family transcriptional regulator